MAFIPPNLPTIPRPNPRRLSDEEEALTARALAEGSRNPSGGQGKFALINLCGGGTFTFDFFPTAPIEQSRRANWPEQDTTIGTKPLFYANRDPRRLDVREVWLDRTRTGESIKPQIEALFALQDESCEGAPPPLLAVYGDYQHRVILEELRVEEMFHAQSGAPLRARVSLSLKEIQGEESEAPPVSAARRAELIRGLDL